MSVTIYDFTGIYENEGFDFYDKESSRSLLDAEKPEANDEHSDFLFGAEEIAKDVGHSGFLFDAREKVSDYLSLKDISGTNCICDEYAYDFIKNKAVHLTPSNEYVHKISFFDNGNYHYMSKILIDVMCEKLSSGDELSFDLIVFDHHTDMKWTSYGEILSCGSWILNTLKDRPELNRVFIVGADEGLVKETQDEFPEYDGRVFFLSDISRLQNYDFGKVYISVDKDVLSPDEIKTNWDQGNMSITQLQDALNYLNQRFGSDILAIDVCGECLPDSEDAYGELGIGSSNRVNRMILDIFNC
ncbi:hypothetical protein [Butyrivibrio sp. WCE2006]|uniref:hypothetical protein n=1 Tax=Butyrivibrio sp. WCE2006 TaxID=1410611 RepID=UPI0005D1EDDF|nr:hypothetical protein [Butyrivibrio sp. WCE2006]